MLITRISSQLLDDLVQQSKVSSRLRCHHSFHANYADSVQQLANSIDTHSYIRPHRHALDGNPPH